jgi:hypothetical protein
VVSESDSKISLDGHMHGEGDREAVVMHLTGDSSFLDGK